LSEIRTRFSGPIATCRD